MTAEGLEEDKEMSSWALEVHHVYPLKEVRLGGSTSTSAAQQFNGTMKSSGSSCSLERGLEGTGFMQREATNRGGRHM